MWSSAQTTTTRNREIWEQLAELPCNRKHSSPRANVSEHNTTDRYLKSHLQFWPLNRKPVLTVSLHLLILFLSNLHSVYVCFPTRSCDREHNEPSLGLQSDEAKPLLPHNNVLILSRTKLHQIWLHKLAMKLPVSVRKSPRSCNWPLTFSEVVHRQTINSS